MTRYRYLDGMGDVIAEREFGDHVSALAWTPNDDDRGENDDDDENDFGDRGEPAQRVEFLGPDGDWRWAGVPRAGDA